MHELLSEIGRFREWAKTAAGPFGEWEFYYPDWARIYREAEKALKQMPAGSLDSSLAEKWLYILARDNEGENILNLLVENPAHLLFLAGQAVEFPDPDDRWQTAHGLGEVDGDPQEIRRLLDLFMNDPDEYVRRRASFASIKKGFIK